MRRTLLALALLPGAVFAQTLSSQVVATQPTNQLTNGVRSTVNVGAANTGAPLNGYAIGTDGPVTGDQIRAQTEAANNRQRLQNQDTAQAKAEAQDQTPTAAAQGYKADTSKADAQTLADYRAAHTPRQLGQVVSQPSPAHPVATDKAAAGWYANWSYTLGRIGIPDAKVRFEANRLDREAFAAWANRQVMATEAFQDAAVPADITP